MDTSNLRQSIQTFDPDLVIERAWTPPSSWYTMEAVHDLERTLWAHTWQLVAFEHQLRQPGDRVAATVGPVQVVVVRGADGELRAFHNVCRHKGSTICVGADNAPDLVCPYHGWRYGLDGSLESAPQMAGIQDFDRTRMSLPAMSVEQWGPWIFVNAGTDPSPPLLPEVRPLHKALERTGWRDLRHAGTRSWDIDCNWKVYCDNYLDGGYHVAHIHPSLGDELSMETYRTELFGCFNVQSVGAATGDSQDLATAPSTRIGDGALYAWIYPNTMINRYGPVLDVNRVLPVAPNRCVVHFDWWFDAGCDDDFIRDSMAQSDKIQQEDLEICERVQNGMESGAFDRGRYAPRLETAMQHFHCLLSRDLRSALE